MICGSCHGTGKRVIRGQALRYRVRSVSLEPCATCGGCGFEHCCDGDGAQSGDYDPAADSIGSWSDAIAELRRCHLAGESVRDLPLFRDMSQSTR